MGFEALLGNDRLKSSLISARQKGRMSHFYLISGPRGSGRHTLADLIAGAMLCREPDGPCGVCRTCRKLAAGNHPDYITIDDPEKKIIPVKLIREARSDMFIRPNEGDKKIYLFPRGQDLNLEGQNTLLKVLEEPPEYGVFLLLCDNPDKLLPTVRSRCVELKLHALPEALLRERLRREFPEAEEQTISGVIMRSGGYLGQARELLAGKTDLPPQTTQLVQAFCNRDPLLLVQTLTPMEKWKREQFLPVLQQWVELFEGALACRAGVRAISDLSAQLAAARSATELNAAIASLQKAIEYSLGNVSTGAICGWLRWNLR